VKIYVNFGGAEILMESAEERRAWKQLRGFLVSAKLVEGAGVACEQLPKVVAIDPQAIPSTSAVIAVEKLAC